MIMIRKCTISYPKWSVLSYQGSHIKISDWVPSTVQCGVLPPPSHGEGLVPSGRSLWTIMR